MIDWTPYLTGGAAARSDSMSGMTPDFQSALAAMFADAPEEIRSQLQIKSGFRSPELQAKLWQDALAKYGSPEIARKWVAPPGKSQHGHGNASDLGYLSPAARAWAHQNAGKYGLAFPLANEDWHIELASARGGPALHGGALDSGQVATQPEQQAPVEKNPLRLAWAYRTGKMTPEDAALYEKGLSAGAFEQPAQVDPLAAYQRVAQRTPRPMQVGQFNQLPMPKGWGGLGG